MFHEWDPVCFHYISCTDFLQGSMSMIFTHKIKMSVNMTQMSPVHKYSNSSISVDLQWGLISLFFGFVQVLQRQMDWAQSLTTTWRAAMPWILRQSNRGPVPCLISTRLWWPPANASMGRKELKARLFTHLWHINELVNKPVFSPMTLTGGSFFISQ